MITNFYTLFHIAAVLDREFSGCTISEIFTQHREELIVSFQSTTSAIIIGCGPANNYLFSRNNFMRSRKNSVTLFKTVKGSTIDKIMIHPADRQINIHLKDSGRLILQFFGSKANVSLVNGRNTIIDAFLKKSDVKAEVLDIAPETGRSNSSETLADILTTYEDQPVRTALKRTFQRLGPALVQELLTMSDLNGEESVRNLSKDEIGILEKNEHRLVEELLSKPAPRIYFDGTTPVRFSIIPLIHLKDLLFQNFGSISEGIQTYLAAIHHDKEAKREKEGILKVLKHEYDNSERTLKNISAETELPNLPAQYEKYGKLLMGQLHLFKKGDDIACVEDFSGSSGDIIEIPLDIHLTPVKNAERYFEKAERSKRKLEEQSRRIAELTQKKKSISQLLEKLEDALTTSDLQQFADENRKQLAQFGLKSKKSGHIKKEEPVPFRVFIVAGGFRVWAGKSGENNDLLSTRHTAKNDLWFHARGVGGSHVVLKIGTGKGEVSKQAIEQAAGIAAYYSKMKKSKLVPVTMCQGKYVRKPKGVPPGTVVVEREKTIFAEPGLPQAS